MPEVPMPPGTVVPKDPNMPEVQVPPALPFNPDFPDIAMDPENPDVPQLPCKGEAFASARDAIKQRNADLATEKQLVDLELCLMKSLGDVTTRKKDVAVSTLYKGLGDTFSWDPGKDSQTLLSVSPLTWPVLHSNADSSGSAISKENEKYALIQAGERQGQRYILFGGGILGGTESYPFMDNVVTWLTKNNASKINTYKLAKLDVPVMNVVVSQPSKNYFDDYKDIVKWLESEYPGGYKINEEGTCNYNDLLACLKKDDVDLLIFGGFDSDPSRGGYGAIKDGIEYAKSTKIPVVSISHGNVDKTNGDKESSMQQMFYRAYGVLSYNNYWDRYKAINVPVADHRELEPFYTDVPHMLDNVLNKNFSSSWVPDCNNIINCHTESFDSEFRSGADFFRDQLTQLDLQHIDVLANDPLGGVISSGVLLSDKYKKEIDYPIKADDEPGEFLHAMFADWVVSYARADNIAQPDLGVIVQDKNNVLKGSQSTYAKTVTADYQNVVFDTISPGQWTTSGWFAQPGDKITIKSESLDNPDVYIHLGYKRGGATRIGREKIYLEPVDFAMRGNPRITLHPGEEISFSTPYGAPIYINYNDDDKTRVVLSARNVARHPALMDVNDAAKIDEFDALAKNNSLPNVDIVIDEGTEIHGRKDHIITKINDDIYDTKTLIKAYENYLHWFNSLGGFKETGKSLKDSLTPGDLLTCSHIFGEEDCTDEKLHSKSFIQHANFDQYASCGIGCGGNPFDSQGIANPYGWLVNHEEGHSLQINKLNVQYVPVDDKQNWTNYSSRGDENSNNIFPYYSLWKFTNLPGRQTQEISDGPHYYSEDVYSVIMSELRDLKDESGNPVIYDVYCTPYEVTDGTPVSRYTAPWQSNDYAVYNRYRQAFYIQMALQADKMKMRGGSNLTSGFDIFTLLYQHARIFDKYANDADWENHKSALGFSEFPFSDESTYGGEGYTVESIPGNDFMLISLSYITNHDWRPYFDMFGLNYTDMASKQVDANGFADAVKEIIWLNPHDPEAFPDETFSEDPNFVKIDMTDKNAELPAGTVLPEGADLQCLKPSTH